MQRCKLIQSKFDPVSHILVDESGIFPLRQVCCMSHILIMQSYPQTHTRRHAVFPASLMCHYVEQRIRSGLTWRAIKPQSRGSVSGCALEKMFIMCTYKRGRNCMDQSNQPAAAVRGLYGCEQYTHVQLMCPQHARRQ